MDIVIRLDCIRSSANSLPVSLGPKFVDVENPAELVELVFDRFLCNKRTTQQTMFKTTGTNDTRAEGWEIFERCPSKRA